MLVREEYVDAKTGERGVRWVEVPGVVTEADGKVLDAAAAVLETNQRTIEQQADQALATNTSFLGIASPTNAQTLAQVKALTRQNNKIIRLLLRKFDATD